MSESKTKKIDHIKTYQEMILTPEKHTTLELYETFVNKNGSFSQVRFDAYLQAANSIINELLVQPTATDEEKEFALEIQEVFNEIINYSPEDRKKYAMKYLAELKKSPFMN